MVGILLRKRLYYFERSLSIFVTFLDSERQDKYRPVRVFAKYFWISIQLLHTYRSYYEIYKLNPSFEKWIVLGAVAYVVATAIFYIVLVFIAYEVQKALVIWCETRKTFVTQIKENFDKFPEKFQTIYNDVEKYSIDRFQQAEESSARGTKLLGQLVCISYLTLPFTNPLLGYFLSDQSYTLPFFLTLPYVPVTGIKTYVVNYVYQVIELIVGCAAFFIFYSICIIVVLHLTAQIDVLIHLCQILKSEAVYEVSSNKTCKELKPNEKQETENQGKENKVVFRKIDSKVMVEWVRLFVKIHNDLTDALSLFQDMSSSIFLMFYSVCYGSLYLIYFVIVVEQETYSYASAVLSIPFILFLICVASETVIEKFKQVMDALYAIPWYEMHSKDRKALIPIIQALQSSEAFKAGGLKELTFNNYVSIINTAYSNSLVLKSFIKD